MSAVRGHAATRCAECRQCPHLVQSVYKLTGTERNCYFIAFRALSGLAPDYLAGDCQLVGDSGLRSLRSAERRVCSVPRQNNTFGDRSFAAAGPRAWNELPSNLRDTALSLTVFNAHLKTHLFSISCGATAHL